MASQLKVDTITGVTTAGSIAVTGEGNSTTTNLQQGLCKAWSNITGTGTASLDDSLNIASLTDNGTGDYSFTVSSAFNSAEYSTSGSKNSTTYNFAVSNFTSTVHRAYMKQDDSTAADPTHLSTQNFGDLA